MDIIKNKCGNYDYYPGFPTPESSVSCRGCKYSLDPSLYDPGCGHPKQYDPAAHPDRPGPAKFDDQNISGAMNRIAGELDDLWTLTVTLTDPDDMEDYMPQISAGIYCAADEVRQLAGELKDICEGVPDDGESENRSGPDPAG